MRSPVSRCPGKQAFTLIELFVVIAIIAILAAILFPVFAQAREKARQSACLSNTKQMGMAHLQYAQDYDETIVIDYQAGTTVANYGRYSAWRNRLYPYIKNTGVFLCPSAPNLRPATVTIDGASVTFPDATQNYGVNEQVVPYNAANPSVEMSRIKAPAQLPLIFDCSVGLAASNAFYRVINANCDDYQVSTSGGYCTGGDPPNNGTIPSLARHNGGSIILFADGHSRFYLQKQLAPSSAISTSYKMAWGIPVDLDDPRVN